MLHLPRRTSALQSRTTTPTVDYANLTFTLSTMARHLDEHRAQTHKFIYCFIISLTLTFI